MILYYTLLRLIGVFHQITQSPAMLVLKWFAKYDNPYSMARYIITRPRTVKMPRCMYLAAFPVAVLFHPRQKKEREKENPFARDLAQERRVL